MYCLCTLRYYLFKSIPFVCNHNKPFPFLKQNCFHNWSSEIHGFDITLFSNKSTAVSEWIWPWWSLRLCGQRLSGINHNISHQLLTMFHVTRRQNIHCRHGQLVTSQMIPCWHHRWFPVDVDVTIDGWRHPFFHQVLPSTEKYGILKWMSQLPS
jgi:hypothetical protein